LSLSALFAFIVFNFIHILLKCITLGFLGSLIVYMGLGIIDVGNNGNVECSGYSRGASTS